MDYRSDEARHINSLFMNARLANIYEPSGSAQIIVGYKHRTIDMMYLRTNKDRLIRVDGPATDYQYNELSVDKQRFEPLDGAFIAGEHVDRARPFLRSHLIPPQTMYEFGRDAIMPKFFWLLAGAGLAAGLRPAVTFAQDHMHSLGAVGAVGATHAAIFAAHDEADDAHLPDHEHDVHGMHTDASAHEHVDVHTHAHHDVPGTAEHPVDAPNGCPLDGSAESAASAMLPGPCRTKTTWMAFDVRDTDDAWEDVAEPSHARRGPFYEFSDPDAWRELTAADYAVLGTCAAGAVGAAAGVTAGVLLPEGQLLAEDLRDRLARLCGEEVISRRRPPRASIFRA